VGLAPFYDSLKHLGFEIQAFIRGNNLIHFEMSKSLGDFIANLQA